MEIKNVIIYFLTGGIMTTLMVSLELGGFRLLSGLAAIFPAFTLISYIFIGNKEGGMAVSQNAKLVILGTLIVWIPYMLTIVYLAPRIGPHKALFWAISLFLLIAIIFLLLLEKYHLFQ